jgi:hypothetical protein
MAHETGYLDVRSADGSALLEAYAFWCWRRRVPMVWFERRTRHSKYGRLHLDMFTTPFRLSPRGRAAMEAAQDSTGRNAHPSVSFHDACWNWIPLNQLGLIAQRVVASATRTGHYEPNKPKLVSISAGRRDRMTAGVSLGTAVAR